MGSQDETTLSFSNMGALPAVDAEQESVATLVVMCGDQVGRRYLIQDRAIIGRTAQATVYIPDPQISRSHAEIVRDGSGTYIIVDMESRNGTLVNGLQIRSHQLSLGDQIQIGSSVLLFTQRDPGVEQLLHRQKLEALGRIGAGVAHDFNNLLGAVMASLDYIGTLPLRPAIRKPRCLRVSTRHPYRVQTCSGAVLPPAWVRATQYAGVWLRRSFRHLRRSRPFE